MMQGYVSHDREPMLRLVVGNQAGERQVVDALIDTGYTQYLSLPNGLIQALSLPWVGTDRVTLGDGSETMFEVYDGLIIWNGEFRSIPIHGADADALIGINLLYGFDLTIRVIEGGIIEINAMDEIAER
jgi:clan AA aspartic protease